MSRRFVFGVGDIYSFAIILQQIILRCEPYQLPTEGEELDISNREIVLEVQKGSDPPLRPRVPRVACSNEVCLSLSCILVSGKPAASCAAHSSGLIYRPEIGRATLKITVVSLRL